MPPSRVLRGVYASLIPWYRGTCLPTVCTGCICLPTVCTGCVPPYMPPYYPFHCWVRYEAQRASQPLEASQDPHIPDIID